MPISIETFFLDRSGPGTLQTKVRQMVAQGILSGRFRAGDRLPSSRKLATHLGVSRITITLAYTELLADDYLTSRGRSGYFVSENAPEPSTFTAQAPTLSHVDWPTLLGDDASQISMRKPPNWSSYRYPFIYGQADPSLFDANNWRNCALQALGRRNFDALTEDQYDGDDPELVDFITRHTLPRRGILAAPDEVLLTLGAQNALWLTAQTLLSPNRHAAIEDPGYPALRDILLRNGCAISALPVDANGLDLATLPPSADVVFTTPSHQCPTTTTLPLEQRKTLLEWADNNDAIIVEDDYEFEMPFAKSPSPALKALDSNGRVVYVGSFSKSIFPGNRLGYLVGPAPFIARARALRAAVLRHPPGHIQRTTAYFLSLGHYDALIRRTARAYQTRRLVMETAIEKHGLKIAGHGSFGGSSLWMQAPNHIDTTQLASDLRQQSVLIEPGANFFAAKNPPQNFYRIAYSSIPPERIPDGIARIAAALN